MIESVTKIKVSGIDLIECFGTIENLEEWKELGRLTSDIIFKSELKKVIVDERNVIHKEDVFMVCELIQSYIDNLPPETKSIRIAVIVNIEERKIADFWETYGVNRGFNWKVFTNLDKAIDYINA